MASSCADCGIQVFKKPKDWRKQLHTCSNCSKVLCGMHYRKYVDGSNEAITRNSPVQCIPCFFIEHDRYGDKKMVKPVLTSDQLQAKALQNVCACYAYDLPNFIDDLDDSALEAIIADGMVNHYETQKHDPVRDEEFQEELRRCPDYLEKAA